MKCQGLLFPVCSNISNVCVCVCVCVFVVVVFSTVFVFFSVFYNILLRILNKMFSLGRVRKTESHIWRNVNRWPRHIAR